MENDKQNILFPEWKTKKDNFKIYKHVKSDLIYGNPNFDKPFISIIIPTFKRSHLLKAALDSAIMQKGDYEILVIDNDNEIDLSSDILMKEYCDRYKNIFYYRNNVNLGMYGNWNRCIELSRTKWFCLLHDDDLLKDNYLETVVPIIKSDPEMAILSIYRENMDERDIGNKMKRYAKYGKNTISSSIINLLVKLRHGKKIKITIDDCMNFLNPLLPCAVFNRDKALDVGGYDKQYFPVSDLFFIFKITYYYDVYLLPQYLWNYRYSENESMKKDTLVNALWFTRYLFEEVAKELNYSLTKTKSKYSEAVISMWNGNLKLCPNINYEEIVLKKCNLAEKYRKKHIIKWVQIKRHLLRMFLFFKN